MEQTRYSWAAYDYHRASKRRERERQARMQALQESLTNLWVVQQGDHLRAAAQRRSPMALLVSALEAVLTLLVCAQVRALGVVARFLL